MSKEKVEQIKRIRQMEKRLNDASSVIKRLSADLDILENLQQNIDILNEYYGSEIWRKDYADDEAGLLPQELKRGVLSEDGIWNLLSDFRELKARLLEFEETNKEKKET